MSIFYIHLLIYWTLSFFCYVFDWLVQYNLVVDMYKQNPINTSYWKYCHKSIKSSFVNQMILTLPVLRFIEQFIIDDVYMVRWIEICKLLVYIICADFWFYTLHYLYHTNPYLYRIHKFHHRLRSTSAASALDAHPIEHLLINLGSVSIGPLLWNCYIPTLQVWVFITTATSCLSHSGFKYNLVGSAHNLHHKLCKYNYGQGFYLMDRIFGTFRDYNSLYN